MSIQPDQTLLHYRIVEKLGEGGMGVVWKAVDTTLDRDVAIKVLPDWGTATVGAVPAMDERLARFEREARLLASLNHPNIAGVYGLHAADTPTGSLRFIAMELVPGEDLSERLRSGSLPPAEALAIARQVADALATAHDSGVIHRDLKPANIRLTPEGKVKVLDFGLAKALDAATASGSGDPALSPTLTSLGTRAGMILGTAAYMSPEQARGKPVDRRADIWAFGCVLYEMLTSRPTFGGDTVTDVLASILKSEPDLSTLAGRVPPRVVRLLERCLEKDLAKRLRDAGDIRLEIDELLKGDLTAPLADAGAASAGNSWMRLALVAVAALVLGVALARVAGIGGRGAAQPSETRRMTVTTGDERTIRSAKISRNGRLLVLLLDDGAYVRKLDSFELQKIPDSAGLTGWAESPDGQSIVFFTVDDNIIGGGKLRRMSLATGTTVVVRESGDGLAPLLWREDGILAVSGKKVWRLGVEAGEPELLFEVAEGHFHGGSAIPGASAMLLVRHQVGGETEWSVEAVDFESNERRQVVANARGGTVTPGGQLLFVRDGTLIGAAFDRTTLAPSASLVPILSGVQSFSVSDDGTLAYLPADEDAQASQLVLVDRQGQQEVLIEGDVSYVRYAPNGRWISSLTGDSIKLVDRQSGSVRPLLNEGFGFADQVWRPDSRAIVYTGYSEEGSRCVLFEHPLDGGAPRVLYETDAEKADIFPTGYAPDGSGFIFSRYADEDADLWWMPADGSEARPLLASNASEDLARFSPDGKLVAYESNESGRQEVWVAVYRPDEGRLAEKWQISQEGGRDPIWSPDGGELYFEDIGDRLVAVTVAATADGLPAFGERNILFDLRALTFNASGDESYDVAPSGDSWVFIQDGASGATEVRVVLNWVEELERVVPGDRD